MTHPTGPRVSVRARWWAAVALLTVGDAGCARRSDVATCPDCSYLLVTVDTLRPDHTSLYGYPRDTTPRLRALFEGQAVFSNATTTAPCTLPAIPQLLSGNLLARGPRLAELLRPRLRTAAVVSQHQFYRSGGGDRFAAGFEHFDVQAAAEVDHHGLATRTADVVADRAITWLSAVGATERFFLWLHFFDPHDPYEPPRRLRRWSGPEPHPSGDRRTSRAARHEPLEATESAGLNALYDGEIAFVDEQVGRVLDALARAGRLVRTVVVFTADHGEWLGEEDRWDHCQSLTAEELSVPLALSLPASRFPPALLRGAPVSTLDVVPTILALEGLPPSPAAQGSSLLDATGARRALSAFRLAFRVDDGELVATARAVVPGPPAVPGGSGVKVDLRRARLVPMTLLPSRGPVGRSVLHLEPATAERLLEPFAPLLGVGELGEGLDQIESLRAVGYIQ